MRGDTHSDIPMEPTMSRRLATVVITTVSHRPTAPDGDGGDNDVELMRPLEVAFAWGRMDATCGAHALAESGVLITTVLAMLMQKSSTVARASCATEARSNNEDTIRYSVVPRWHVLARSLPHLPWTSVRGFE
jgi:hypothetical protein